MKKTLLLSFLLVFPGVTGIAASQQYDDLVKLIKSGVSEEVLVAYINASNCAYALSSDDIVRLKQYGATAPVIVAAIKHKGSVIVNSHTPAAPAADDSTGVMTAAQGPEDTVTVNVPNARGGYTPVKLVKTDKGYTGPKGELYAGHPTVRQLTALYGK